MKRDDDILPVWLENERVRIIDQRRLPFELKIETLKTTEQVVEAIADMHVRGAPIIGITAAFGAYIAVLESRREKDPSGFIKKRIVKVRNARPTAVNLIWATDRMESVIFEHDTYESRASAARKEALMIAAEEEKRCRQIGKSGLVLIEEIGRRKKGRVNILTHCNAGWLACGRYGTATAPIYEAHRKKLDLHVWVDETRPLNQGARLTAWELGRAGIRHTIITDNAGGHLMQRGMVDMVIVGTDRTTKQGDVANKIGTYLKALAARDNGIPFYVALPSSTFDFSISEDATQIPIEERDPEEVRWIEGITKEGSIRKVRICPEESRAANYAFDVTPARLVTGFITEKGVCRADYDSIRALFP